MDLLCASTAEVQPDATTTCSQLDLCNYINARIMSSIASVSSGTVYVETLTYTMLLLVGSTYWIQCLRAMMNLCLQQYCCDCFRNTISRTAKFGGVILINCYLHGEHSNILTLYGSHRNTMSENVCGWL